MSDEKPVVALDLPYGELSDATQAYFAKCEEKLGLVPNVLKAYAFDEHKLRCFTELYNDLMLGESDLSKLEREMIAVVVSAANRCHYCVIAHGAALRELTGDAELVDTLAINHRTAALSDRHRAMVDYAHALTVTPAEVGAAHHKALHNVGFSDRAIWDIASVAAFFNMTNRVATATKMVPNPEYYRQGR